MENFIKVAKKQDISSGSMKTFKIKGKNVTVVNFEDEFFAIEDTCSHAQCSLGEGVLDGKTVVCPCHGGQFDVTSGKVLAMPPTEDISTYKVKVEDEDVLVEID